jgi:TPR repeat protein
MNDTASELHYEKLQGAIKKLCSAETEEECQDSVTSIRLLASSTEGKDDDKKETSSAILESQFQLGFLYQTGDVVLKNYEEANKWFLLAAARGHVKSQCILGFAYESDKVPVNTANAVNKNKLVALEWYKKSASNGCGRSFINLAIFYHSGKCNLPVDVKRAEELIKEGRDMIESTKSISNIADYYNTVSFYRAQICNDIDEALKYGFLAATFADVAGCDLDKDSILAKRIARYQKDFGYLLKCYKELAVKKSTLAPVPVPTFSLALDDEKLNPIYWYEKAAKGGNLDAMCDFGNHLFKNGMWKEAMYWMKRGALRGHDLCALKFAKCYDPIMFTDLIGKVDKNIHEAIKWYKVAASRENMEALLKLIDLFCIGNCGVTIDCKYAYNLCYKAVDIVNRQKWQKWQENKERTKQYTGICLYLGQLYYHGMGTDKNYELALKWLKISSGYENSGAQYLMGLYFYEGIKGHLTQDYFAAISLWEKSGKKGNSASNLSLGKLYLNGQAGVVQKNIEKATEYFIEASSNNDASCFESSFYLGKIYSQQSSSKESIKWFRKVSSILLLSSKVSNEDIVRSHIHLIREIDHYVEYDLKLSIEERNKLEVEATEHFKKVEELRNHWSVHQNEINKIDHYYSMGRHVVDEKLSELITPFQRLLICNDKLDNSNNIKQLTLEELINRREFSLDEVMFIGKQLCAGFLHLQNNGFVLRECNMMNVYILLPRAYQVRQMYVDAVLNSVTNTLPRDIINIIGDYLNEKIVDIKDVTTDILLRSQLVINPKSETLVIQGEKEEKGTSSYTLGYVLMLLCSNLLRSQKSLGSESRRLESRRLEELEKLISMLVEKAIDGRMKLDDAFLFFNQ